MAPEGSFKLLGWRPAAASDELSPNFVTVAFSPFIHGDRRKEKISGTGTAVSKSGFRKAPPLLSPSRLALPSGPLLSPLFKLVGALGSLEKKSPQNRYVSRYACSLPVVRTSRLRRANRTKRSSKQKLAYPHSPRLLPLSEINIFGDTPGSTRRARSPRAASLQSVISHPQSSRGSNPLTLVLNVKRSRRGPAGSGWFLESLCHEAPP